MTLPFGQFVVTNSILILVLLNALITLKLKDWRAAVVNPIFYLPAGFMLFYTISILWSNNRIDGALQLETKATLFLAPLALVASSKFLTEQSLQQWLRAFVWGNVLVMLLAFAIASYKAISLGGWYTILDGGIGEPLFTYKVLSGPFMHPGYLATYVGVAILIAISFFFSSTVKRPAQLAIVICFLFLSLFMLQGRINVLAIFTVLIAGGLIYAIRMKAYKWLLVPVIPLALLVVLLLFGSESMKTRYFQMPDFQYDITADASSFNSATYRLAEWTCAIDAVRENPLIGAGVGDNRNILYESYEKRNFHVGLEQKFNAHNQYLEVTIAAGMIGLALFMIWIIGYGVIAWKNRDYLFIAIWSFFLISMITESMLERAWMTTFCGAFFPLALLGAKKK